MTKARERAESMRDDEGVGLGERPSVRTFARALAPRTWRWPSIGTKRRSGDAAEQLLT